MAFSLFSRGNQPRALRTVRSTPKSSRSFRPVFEVLEKRELLNGTPFVNILQSGPSALENAGAGILTVTLSEASRQPVSVNYAVFGGTAKPNIDFSLLPGKLTFLPGETSKTIPNFVLLDETLSEADETVIVSLSTPVNAKMGSNKATFTILDDDPLPTVAFTSPTASGLESVASASLTVALSAVAGRDVTVAYTVAGTATFGSDHNRTAGVLTILAGQMSKTITLPIVNDLLDEADETVQVTLTSASGAVLGTPGLLVHTYTILDNDALPTVAFNAATSAGPEITSPVPLSVTLSAISGRTVTVNYIVAAASTATGGGVDHALAAGSLVFAPGETTKIISLPIIADDEGETNETVIVTLTSVIDGALGAIATHTRTIQNSGTSVGFALEQSSGSEAVAGHVLDVTLNAATNKNVSVKYTVTGVTAKGGGTDFTLVSGTVTIPAGQTQASIPLTLVNDTLSEAGETFLVTLSTPLSTPVNALFRSAKTHTFTILDNDLLPSVSFQAAASSGAESVLSVPVRVNLSTASGQMVAVPYTITGTAANGSDHTLAAGNVVIAAGAVFKNLVIPILNDGRDEPNETIVVTLGTPIGASLGAQTVHTYTINDDDNPPSVAFTAASSLGSAASSLGSEVQNGSLTVTLSRISDHQVTVTYIVAGTAAFGDDHTLANGTVTFAPGDKTKTILIPVVDDAIRENTETVRVTLTAAANAKLGAQKVHTYSITDNDASVGFDVAPPILEIQSPTSVLVIRTNLSVTGNVTDALSGVADLQRRIDNGAFSSEFRLPNGDFSFFTDLPLNGSADGGHTVTVRAIDHAGNVTTASFPFTLDTQAPAVPTFDLDTAFDSGPDGDGITEFETVTLVGQTTANVQVILNLTGATTTSDGNGDFSFTGVVLPEGTTVVRIRARDAVGNESFFDRSLTRIVGTPINFGDPDLAAAVRRALGVPQNAIITDNMLEELTSLSADSNIVSSLVGLEAAINLQSFQLMPSNYSIAGSLSDLTPIEDLQFLFRVTLVGAGLSGNELAPLAQIAGLQSLDLRYNGLADISAVTGHPMLKSLLLYGNPNVDPAPLAGRFLDTDLPDGRLDQADTIAEVAAALHYLPAAMFEFVVNNFAYQPYEGSMKGALAALETRAGNDWDLAALLAGLMQQAGLTTRFVSGRTEADAESVANWLGVTDGDAAAHVLNNAGQDALQYVDGNGETISIEFDHTWLEVELHVPGVGTTWVALDPSWKMRDYRPGIPDLFDVVPFNQAAENAYLSETRTELAYEWYEDEVAQYLTANVPGVSVADVAYTGPIRLQTLAIGLATLPYDVVGTPTAFVSIPVLETHRVDVSLVDSFTQTELFATRLVIPEMSLKRLTVGYAPGAGNMLIPQLLLDGVVIDSGPEIPTGDLVTLYLDHLDPGDDLPDRQFDYQREAGQYISIGLDANQVSTAFINRLQAVTNQATIASLNGQTFTQDDQLGGLLSLAILKWFHDTNKGQAVVNGLTGAASAYPWVESGLATSETTFTVAADLQNPAIPVGASVDIANTVYSAFSIDGNDAMNDRRRRLQGLNGSAQEHAIWEELLNAQAVSTVKSLQIAYANGIPVLTIDSTNVADQLDDMTVSQAVKNHISQLVGDGATVVSPRDPTNVGSWQGVGYLVTFSNNSVGYLISGGLNGKEQIMAGGFSGGDTEDAPNTPKGNNPNDHETGDPVNIANGNVTRDETDIAFPGIGIPLLFSRHFDSQSILSVGMGPGWVHSYSDFLTFEQGGAITWTDSQGQRYTFTPDSGSFLEPDTLHGEFTSIAGNFRYRDKSGMTYDFDAAGRLTRITDRNSNALVLAYNINTGRLASVSEAATPSRQLAFTFTGTLLTGVSDFTGRTWTYSYNAAGRLAMVTRPADANVPASSIQYEYYTDDARDGLLRQVTGANGGVISYSYYPNRRAFQVTGAEGFTQTFSYNLFRRQSTFIDERGNATEHYYNDAGNLIEMLRPDRSKNTWIWQNSLMLSSIDAFGLAETYQYDSLGNMTRMVNREGNQTLFTYDLLPFSNLASVTEPGGRLIQYNYDSQGNLTELVDALGGRMTMTYDGRGQIVSVTDPRGNLTAAPDDFTFTFTYNTAGQLLTRNTLPSYQETYTYDNRGNMQTRTDANNHAETYDYDILDRMILNTDAAGEESSFAYDAIDNMIASTDRLGRSMSLTFDLRQLVTRATNADGTFQLFAYDPAANLVGATDELGHATGFIIDSRNRRASVLRADGASAVSYYDPKGRVIGVRDPLGNLTSMTYDAMGRLETMTDALGNTQTLEYDVVGNMTSFTDPLNRTSTFEYDLLNRETKNTDALGNFWVTAYDPVGNVRSVTDPLLHTTQYTYDLFNRQLTTTNALNQVTAIAYDAVGNIVSITDPVLNSTTFGYDERGRRISETEIIGATPVSRTYDYDAEDNLIAATDRNGRVREFTIDLRNRLTNERWLDGATTLRTIHYTYDASGQLLGVSDPDSTYALTYDLVGRTTSVSNHGTAGVPEVVLDYFYDAAGNRVATLDTIDGTTHGFQQAVYDVLNRVTQVSQSGAGVTAKRVDFAYNDAGQFSGLTRFSNLSGTALVASTQNTYDNAGRLTGIQHARNATTIANYSWTLDGASRKTQDIGPDGTTDYTYDNNDQLTGANHSAQTNEAYAYDANGNRTGAGMATGDHNRMLSDGVYNYEYDAEGNRTRRVEIATNEVTTYTWDHRNRLTRVVVKNSGNQVIMEASYAYDAFDRRIAKTVDADGAGSNAAATERFVYDGMHITLTFDGAGTQTHRYLHGPMVDQVFADENAQGQILWPLADSQGTVRDLVNSTGVVQNHIKYDSFGQITDELNVGIDFNFGYTGREYDAETGLYYYRARYYDPAVGRFVSEDPTGFAAGDANLYRYVANSPVNGTDPTGLWSVGFLVVVPLILVGAGAKFVYENWVPHQVNERVPTPDQQKLIKGAASEEQRHILTDKFKGLHEYYNPDEGMVRVPDTATNDYYCHDLAWGKGKAQGGKHVMNVNEIVTDPEGHGYRELWRYESLRPGDRVTYARSNPDAPSHSAIVDHIAPDGTVMMRSKDDDNSEFIHRLGSARDKNYFRNQYGQAGLRYFRPTVPGLTGTINDSDAGKLSTTLSRPFPWQ